MRIKFVKMPGADDDSPFDLSRFEVGQVYEVGPRLAEYLIVCGCAKDADMPVLDVAADRPTPKPR
jgi:hypothetical protein